MNKFHEPVLLKETLHFLDVRQGKKYIDATVGGGGHSIAILKQGGVVLGIDWDEEAVVFTTKRWKEESSEIGVPKENFRVVQGNFAEIKTIAHLQGFKNVYGIIFDLGLSSHQVDMVERGFSFQEDAPLDMRMDRRLGVTAADLINALSKRGLYELLTTLGEEHFAWPIASHIIRSRGVKPIQTTGELVKVIAEANRLKKDTLSSRKRAQISKRVFQALRIAVNSELQNIKTALPQALELLTPGGKMLVISFHSLEDRIVKNTFQAFQSKHMGKILTNKPVTPTTDELVRNPRSRSSRLRVFEKL